MLAEYWQFNVSPLDTDFVPPVKAPQEYNTPAVLSMVVTAPAPKTKKQPPTDPVDVIANAKGPEVYLVPPEELDQDGVLRGPV